jgi:hypothetical protein
MSYETTISFVAGILSGINVAHEAVAVVQNLKYV